MRMSKSAKKYYNNLKLLLPVNGKNEKRLLKDIQSRLAELSEESTSCSYEQICDELGDPSDIVINYYNDIDAEYLIKKLRFTKFIKGIAICIIIAISVLTLLDSFYLHKLYLENKNTIVKYRTEVIE